MVRRIIDQIRFKDGLVTDNGPTTPENQDSCSTLDNFVQLRDQSWVKRERLAWENLSLVPATTPTRTTLQVKTYLWRDAANSGKDLIVVARYQEVVTSGTTNSTHTVIDTYLSNSPYTPLQVSSIELNDVFLGNNSRGPVIVDAMLGFDDKLLLSVRSQYANFVSRPTPGIVILKFDPDTNSVSNNAPFATSQSPLLIRDTNRKSTSAAGAHPTTPTRDHIYDLYNNGWEGTDINAYNAEASLTGYPSLNQQPQLGVDSTGAFDPVLLEGQQFSDNYVQGGRFLVDPFNPDTQRESNLIATHDGSFTLPGSPFTGYDVNANGSAPARIIAMEEFGGRVWYLCFTDSSDDTLNEYGNLFLLFSRVGKKPEDILTCASFNDPTGAFDNNALPTDGGYISISAKGTPTHMTKAGNNLVIFTTQGVYMFKLLDGIFDPTALSFSFDKLSEYTTQAWDDTEDTYKYYNQSTGLIAHTRTLSRFNTSNGITASGTYFFLSQRGVETIQYIPDANSFRVISLSEGRLNNFFSEIPQANLANAVPVYIPRANTIIWSLADGRVNNATTSPWGPTSFIPESHNICLVFDISQNRFSTFSLGSAGGQNSVNYYPCFAYYVKPATGAYSGSEDDRLSRPDTYQVKFLVHDGNALENFQVCSFTSASAGRFTQDYLDAAGDPIVANSGVDYTELLRTNEITVGNTSKDKKPWMIQAIMERTEKGTWDNSIFGSVRVRVAFEFSDWGSSFGKVTPYRQMYGLNLRQPNTDATFDYGASQIKSSYSPRGQGTSFKLEVSGEVGKLAHIHNFNIMMMAPNRNHDG